MHYSSNMISNPFCVLVFVCACYRQKFKFHIFCYILVSFCYCYLVVLISIVHDIVSDNLTPKFYIQNTIFTQKPVCVVILMFAPATPTSYKKGCSVTFLPLLYLKKGDHVTGFFLKINTNLKRTHSDQIHVHQHQGNCIYKKHQGLAPCSQSFSGSGIRSGSGFKMNNFWTIYHYLFKKT